MNILSEKGEKKKNGKMFEQLFDAQMAAKMSVFM